MNDHLGIVEAPISREEFMRGELLGLGLSALRIVAAAIAVVAVCWLRGLL